MKEELIRVLNNKLNDINSDIDSLVEINSKIESENENLSYVSGVLDLFRDGETNNILYFSRLNREEFEKVLDIIGENAKDTFNTDSCNYDGLVYLINGINSGISLELNEEQKNAVNYLLDELHNKVEEYSAAIDGYELVKTRYEISDVSKLESKKDSYNKAIDSLEQDDYIEDTELLMEALKYYDLSSEKIIELLGYVLEYNAGVYVERGPREVKETVETPQVEENVVDEENEEKDNNIPFTFGEVVNNESVEETKEEVSQDDTFKFREVSETNIEKFTPITFDENIQTEENSDDTQNEVGQTEEDVYEVPKSFEINDESYEEIPQPEEPYGDDSTVEIPSEYDEIKIDNDVEQEFTNNSLDVQEDTITNEEETSNENDDYEKEETKEEIENDVASTEDLQVLFSKYGLEEDSVYLNELNPLDIDKYQETLEVLKNNELLDRINSSLLLEVLKNSNADNIIKVLDILENDLSVDNEDYAITVKIAIDTIPSVFVTEGGNFYNFVENTTLFKELGLNLINLFDFSKEMFVANNETIVRNLDIVKNYGIDINYKNAKYMLLLPNIGDRLDYYVESVYEDKLKGETFDGAEYVKDYAAKLNVVTDETIKRIRYSSENGRKVFGSKPKSLTGEITNLKVNALDVSSDYLNKFFDNEFANLTGDEVREYVKLIHESNNNVGDYSDEIEILNPYLQGLRYVIEGINISSNKVLRNYDILRSYGMDKRKSLEFAVCYNLVITKEEYDKLSAKLDEIGGNL